MRSASAILRGDDWRREHFTRGLGPPGL